MDIVGNKRARNKIIALCAVVAIAIAAIVFFVVVRPSPSSKVDEPSSSVKDETSGEDDTSSDPDTNAPSQTENETSNDDSSTDAPAIDPATVGTVEIEPVSLVISYIKGVGGFGYEVLRASGGTKYVQLSSERLIGTKCTDDVGEFASIIENPSADEIATIAKTTTVEGTVYGLSLADPACTSDAALLKQYQDSFSSAFSLLKKM